MISIDTYYIYISSHLDIYWAGPSGAPCRINQKNVETGRRFASSAYPLGMTNMVVKNCGLMGFNQQNGDFKGVYPLVI
jgi:hypothetical protein